MVLCPSAPTIELAAPGRRRATRVRHARPQRDSGPTTPMAATMPSSRNMGTAIATVPDIPSPVERATPRRDDVGDLGAEPFGIEAGAIVAAVRRQDLVDDVVRGEGQERLAEGALVERQRGLRRDRHPQRVLRRHLVEADRRQPDPADDHRRLAGLVGQQVEHRAGRPDQLLRGHVRARCR